MAKHGKDIGDLLLEEGVLTAEDVSRLIEQGGWKGTALARALQGAPHVKRRDLAAFLAADFTLPSIADLRDVDVAKDALKAVPEKLAREHTVLPIATVGKILCIATLGSVDSKAVCTLREETGLRIKVLRADGGQLRAAIEKHYGKGGKEIPEPRPHDEPLAVGAPPAASDGEPDALPLISMPDEEPVTVGAAPGPEVEDLLEEIVEVVDAVPVERSEFEDALREAAVRLALEFNQVHDSEKPVPAVRLI
ncbi:MAG: GspE/PulE/PilB domain-containing protein [Planctomycetota bacterium]